MHLILVVIITIVILTISRISCNNPDFGAVRNGVNPYKCFGSIVAVTIAVARVCVCVCVCARVCARC